MVEQGDFVKVTLTGKLEDGTVFDDTKEPLVICVGEGMLLPGIDIALKGKKPGTFSVTLSPEEAFGKKDAQQLQMVPTQQLEKQGIRPQPGMQLNIDGQMGVVKRTGGGRTVVDFNHPLAGKTVNYDVELVEKVDDVHEQVASLVRPLGVPDERVVVKDKSVTLSLDQLPPRPIMDMLQKKIVALTSIGTVHFEQGKK